MHDNHYAKAAMLIRRPVVEVFEAFIDPAITTKFWFTKSSGKLRAGDVVEWTWEMFNHTVPITVKSVIPNKSLLLQFGDDPDSTAEWTFEALDEAQTFVTIINRGFKGDAEEIIAQVREATGGFSWVLAGLKAYLEHGIELNLVADRYPKGLAEK